MPLLYLLLWSVSIFAIIILKLTFAVNGHNQNPLKTSEILSIDFNKLWVKVCIMYNLQYNNVKRKYVWWKKLLLLLAYWICSSNSMLQIEQKFTNVFFLPWKTQTERTNIFMSTLLKHFNFGTCLVFLFQNYFSWLIRIWDVWCILHYLSSSGWNVLN